MCHRLYLRKRGSVLGLVGESVGMTQYDDGRKWRGSEGIVFER